MVLIFTSCTAQELVNERKGEVSKVIPDYRIEYLDMTNTNIVIWADNDMLHPTPSGNLKLSKHYYVKLIDGTLGISSIQIIISQGRWIMKQNLTEFDIYEETEE